MNNEAENDYLRNHTIDFIFRKKVQLKQLKNGYRFGSDAVLLASYVCAKKGNLLELGAGVGAVSLGIAWRYPECRIIAVEKDPLIVELLKENIFKNDMSGQIVAKQTSIENLPKNFESYFDHIFANPPFHKLTGTKPKNRYRNLAHLGDKLNLRDWIMRAIWACKPKGYVSFIIRADRTDEVISIFFSQGMGEITLFPIWPVRGSPANRMIITARKESRTSCIVLPGIILHNTDGSLTSIATLAMKGKGIER